MSQYHISRYFRWSMSFKAEQIKAVLMVTPIKRQTHPVPASLQFVFHTKTLRQGGLFFLSVPYKWEWMKMKHNAFQQEKLWKSEAVPGCSLVTEAWLQKHGHTDIHSEKRERPAVSHISITSAQQKRRDQRCIPSSADGPR